MAGTPHRSSPPGGPLSISASSSPGRVGTHVSAKRRVNTAAVAGASGAAIAAWFLPWQLAALLGWDSAVLVILIWVWSSIRQLDALETQRIATVEDNSRTTATFVVVSASIVSLVGVLLALVKAQQGSTAMEVVLTTVGVLTVVLSWCTVHTMYMLRYAHLYYTAPLGGIDFGDDTRPDYRDFAYLSFTVGMTFQVSDTAVSSRPIRRTITRHALTSWAFGTVIVGLTINVMAGFVR